MFINFEALKQQVLENAKYVNKVKDLEIVVIYHKADSKFVKGLIESLPVEYHFTLCETIQGEGEDTSQTYVKPYYKEKQQEIEDKIGYVPKITLKTIYYDKLDFAYLRNKAKEHSKAHWILSIDADERIPFDEWKKIDQLRAYGQAQKYSFLIHSFIQKDETDYENGYRACMFRNYCKWVNPVHEQITGATIEENANIHVIHYGWEHLEKFKTSLTRNLEILKSVDNIDYLNNYKDNTIKELKQLGAYNGN